MTLINFLLKTGCFEYHSEATMEIRFYPPPGSIVIPCCGFVCLLSDVLKQFLEVYSLPCVATEVCVL